MNRLTDVRKGQTIELDVTPEGERRIVIGLAWNPRREDSPKSVSTPSSSSNIFSRFFRGLKNQTSDTVSAYQKLHNFETSVNQNDSEGQDVDFKHFDLDLYCHVYNDQGELAALVGPEYENAADQFIKIYHSGE